MLGRGRHTARHKDYPVEPKAIGLGGCGTIQLLFTTMAMLLQAGRGSIWLSVYFLLRFSHFHNRFCSPSAADVNHLPPVWFVLKGPQGLLWAFQLPTGPNTFHTG